MLTIFTTLKPCNVAFSDNVQRNAIQSWMALDLPCQILLLGSDEGTAEIAAEYGLHHELNIARIGDSPPLVNDLFARGQELARFSLVMHINADIILLSGFASTFKKIIEERKNNDKNFLIVGQRHDLNLSKPLDFQNPHWEHLLRADVMQRGRMLHPWGVDYFIFRKGNWPREMPAFIIGMDHWDSWLMEHALAEGLDVIDATAGILAIQQDHEDRKDRDYRFRRHEGPMAQYQSSLLPKYFKKFHIKNANLIYTPSGLRRRSVKELLQIISMETPIYRERMKRIIYETGQIKHPRFRALFKALRFLHRIKGFRMLFWVLFTPPRFLNRMLILPLRNRKK